jgi:glycosyltransferase involved in cell wall biosynthesis
MLAIGILVKNEGVLLGELLREVRPFVNEILVVDNGSSDETPRIARDFGCRLFHSSVQPFDLARNVYLENASEPWILTLDADERIEPQHLLVLKRHLATVDNAVYGLRIPRLEYLGGGRWACGEILRVLRNHKQVRYSSASIHASPTPSIRAIHGKEAAFQGAIIHHLDSILGKGRGLSKRHRYVSLLETSLHENGEDFRLHNYLGLERFCLGFHVDAQRELRRAYAIHANVHSRLFLAQQSFLRGNLKRAQVLVTELLQTDSLPGTELVMDRIYTLAAKLALAQNKTDLAVDCCKKAMGHAPALPHHRINVGVLLEDTEPSLAKEFLLQSLELNPYLRKTMIYREEDAQNPYRQQDCLISRYRNVFHHLAECDYRLGNYRGALHWRSTEAELLRGG